jgi:hypothetical protein
MRLAKPNEQRVALVLISSRKVTGFSKENEQLVNRERNLKTIFAPIG